MENFKKFSSLAFKRNTFGNESFYQDGNEVKTRLDSFWSTLQLLLDTTFVI